MKAGKLSEAALKRSVIKQLHSENDSVISKRSGYTDGVAITLLEDEAMILSMDPITLSAENIGMLGVVNALNDVAAAGGRPIGVMVSILLPTKSNEVELRQVIKEIDTTCSNLGAKVLGGHTEVTRAVQEILITVTGVGAVKKSNRPSLESIEPGMDLLVTKWVGLEGSYILANEQEEKLRTRYSQPFIDRAKEFGPYLSICSEAAVAMKSGVTAMHDISEGGVFGALWEMAEAAGVGLEIDLKKIPIRQETVEICEFFDINPYKLLSGGALLLAAKDGNALLLALKKEGIPATIIGKATEGNDRVLIMDGERRFLETTQTDELHKIKE